jgi:hypothetical protein
LILQIKIKFLAKPGIGRYNDKKQTEGSPMRHINQRRYAYIPYPQHTEEPDNPRGKKVTVRNGGCGLCSACMVVDQLTTKSFSVKDAVKLALSVGANHATGTDIMIFGPAVAEKFDLEFIPTDDIGEAIAAVRDGGRVITRVSNRYECNRGIFTKTGHYMVMIAATEQEVCILDPSWTSTKFKKWEQAGLVRTNGTLVYTAPETLHNEGIQILPRYYIFRRKG